MEEKHYKPKKLAEEWGYSVGTVRKLIKDEPGVLKLEGAGSIIGKRSYTTYSVPESVANRIYQRLSQPPLQVALPRRNPRRVVLLGNRNRRVAQQPGYVLQSHAPQEHPNGEGVP
jgi:hypothetical protein